MIIRIKQLLTALCLVFPLATTSYSAESLIVEEKLEENPERWFQIEVIVFQHSDLSDLKSEQWPEHIIKRNYQDVIDFLSPIPQASQTQEISEPSGSNLSNLDLANKPTNIIEIAPALLAPETELPLQDPPLFDFELFTSELPFLPLQKQYFTMADKLSAIKRSRKHRLLKHMTWRQPIFGEKEAVSVRLLGGDDFAENFNPDGTKIQKTSIANELDGNQINQIDSEAENSLNEFTPDDLINAQILEAQPLDAENYFDNLTNEQGLVEEEIPPITEFQELNKALPHVWELDGFITVHLRRYLHIKLDLEIKQLQEKLISIEQFNKFTDSQDFLQNNNEDTGFVINWESVNDPELNVFVNPEDTNTNTLKVEYLQPYPLVQQRRVRSTEIHYFDNPILGVLILITPYDNHPEPEEEQSEFDLVQ